MKEKINVTIEKDRVTELRKIAKADNRTLSSLIDTIVKEWLENK